MIIIDPDEVLDYAFDFGPRLDVGETISSPTVDPVTGLTITPAGKPGPTVSGSTVVVWLTGGTVNAEYDVTCHVATSAGRELDLTMKLWAQQR